MLAQDFGGDWTAVKLRMLGKYLAAYAKILSRTRYRFGYIDAFAGTGYVASQAPPEPSDCLLFPEIASDDGARFLAGSARIALEVRPFFSKYIFVEMDRGKCVELDRLRVEFPEVSDRIQIVHADCNAYLLDLCTNYDWRRNRAVLFLDPFGMEVEWRTVEAIASTRAIDMWYLFPIGMGVNRLLRRDGKIPEALSAKLDGVFGTHEWEHAFYRTTVEVGLFGGQFAVSKEANLATISDFALGRLRSVFAGVAENALVLRNSRNSPLYLLCFAAGNPSGAPLAIKIAHHILGS